MLLAGTWTEQHSTVHPAPRADSAMAYDAANNEIVLFGGQSDNPSSTVLDDTWTWNGTTWTEQHPASSPPARWGATLAYDPTSQVIVLFGGESNSVGAPLTVFGDTWTWNGTNWTEQHPAISPPPRVQAQMANDPTTGGVLLFGGVSGSHRLADTWAWNGDDWTQLEPQDEPQPLAGGAMASTKTGDVLFGGTGSNRSTLSRETWLWNGDTWKLWQGKTGPSARTSLAMTSLNNSGDVLLFGGLSLVSDLGPEADTWLWDGSSWHVLSVSSRPPGREGAAMACDEATGTILLFGGENTYSHETFADTWTYIPQS